MRGRNADFREPATFKVPEWVNKIECLGGAGCVYRDTYDSRTPTRRRQGATGHDSRKENVRFL
jgi:hypothetical protein